MFHHHGHDIAGGVNTLHQAAHAHVTGDVARAVTLYAEYEREFPGDSGIFWSALLGQDAHALSLEERVMKTTSAQVMDAVGGVTVRSGDDFADGADLWFQGKYEQALSTLELHRIIDPDDAYRTYTAMLRLVASVTTGTPIGDKPRTYRQLCDQADQMCRAVDADTPSDAMKVQVLERAAGQLEADLFTYGSVSEYTRTLFTYAERAMRERCLRVWVSLLTTAYLTRPARINDTGVWAAPRDFGELLSAVRRMTLDERFELVEEWFNPEELAENFASRAVEENQ